MQSCCRKLSWAASVIIKRSAKRLCANFATWRGGSRSRMENMGWLQCGDYDVWAWSIAGLETNVVVKGDQLKVAFDMGYSSRHSLKCQHVFISHGHMDHISAVPQHAAKRNLYGMPKATYYTPPHLTDLLRGVAVGYRDIDTTAEVLGNLNIAAFPVNTVVKLPHGFSVETFPTVHRVPSQGYILYRETRHLKPEYVGQPGNDIAALHRQGLEIHNVARTPRMAYLGDTTFEVFKTLAHPDLLKVKVIITEITYIDDTEDSVNQARKRGHTHLSEIIENADLFRDVEHIVLMHLSDKYSVGYLHGRVFPKLPLELKGKVKLATIAKERML